MSHSAQWDCSFLGFYKQKDERERELDGLDNGTHKIVPLKIRAWGLRGLDYERALRRETADGLIFQKNHINLHRGIFTLEPRGTLRDIINRTDIQGNDRDDATRNEEVAPAAEHDDGTL